MTSAKLKNVMKNRQSFFHLCLEIKEQSKEIFLVKYPEIYNTARFRITNRFWSAV